MGAGWIATGWLAAYGLGAWLLAPQAWAQRWEQSGTPPQLVELFTSEGCSSCPPAERQLGALLGSAELWRRVIPVAYHVDYWDYLGWTDPYAEAQHSLRQRLLRRRGELDSVYTPAWLVDGQEWRGFFRREPYPPPPQRTGGRLWVERDGRTVRAGYDGEGGALEAHLVLLGFDQVSQVRAGENRGRRLQHQFVALQVVRLPGDGAWRFELQPSAAGREALALWVTPAGSARPLQVLGGWIEADPAAAQ